MAGVELSLDGVEDIVFHQSGNRDRDPILSCLRLARTTVVTVEVVHADICRPAQHHVHELYAKELATISEPMRVEIGCGGLDPEWASFAIAMEIELEREPDDLGFG